MSENETSFINKFMKMQNFITDELNPKFREIYKKLYTIVKEGKVDIGSGYEIDELFDDEYKTMDDIILKLFYWQINDWDEYYSEHFCQFTANSWETLREFEFVFEKFRTMFNQCHLYMHVDILNVRVIVRSVTRCQYEKEDVLINVEPVIMCDVDQPGQFQNFQIRITSCPDIE